MSLRPDDDPYRTPEDTGRVAALARRSLSHRSQVTRGIAVAFACDTLYSVPWMLLRPSVRPENIASAVESLLLGLNMLVGYAGGRAAARAGLAHDDARAQWSMSWTVGLLSYLVSIAVAQARPALRLPAERATSNLSLEAAIVGLLVMFTLNVLLVRFGFAMGTYAQARRDGLVHEDDEQSED